MNLNFLECYKILGITEECDWVTLRKNYKTLIQQHHPDRFSENTPEHKDSEKAVRYYNAAYKIIFDYYQLNKSLPPRSVDSFKVDKSEPTKRKKRAPVPQPELRTKEKEKSKPGFIRPVIITTIFTSILIFTLYQENSEKDKQIKPAEPVKNLTKINTKNTDMNSEVTKPQDINKEQYYSIGASIGEVIILEGKPNYIVDTTWYYGKSSVTFTNGVVTGWRRHPDHPLKIHINQIAPFNFNKPEKPTISNTKKPYWKN